MVVLVLCLSTLSLDISAQNPASFAVAGCRENIEVTPPAGMVNCDISLLIGCDGKVVPTWQKLHELILEACRGVETVGPSTAPRGAQNTPTNLCNAAESIAANWILRLKRGVTGRYLTSDTEVAFSGISYIKTKDGNVAVGCRCPNSGSKTIQVALAKSDQDPKSFVDDLQVFELVYVPRITSDSTGASFEVYSVALVPAWVFRDHLFPTQAAQSSGYSLPGKKVTLGSERDRLEDLFMRQSASGSLREYLERQPRDEKRQYTQLKVSYFKE